MAKGYYLTLHTMSSTIFFVSSWSAYIRCDLRNRIATGRGLPAKLTLDALSTHYKVSMRPVRLAIDELIDDGYVHRLPNGRLDLNAAKLGRGKVAPMPVEPPADHQERIAHDLVRLSLGGEPVFLREQETAQRYGTSRGTVRQVFNRMAGAGLIEHLPRRGWRLRPFRHEDMDAFNEVRATLELKAFELAWPRLEERRLREILDGNVVPNSPDDRPKIDNSLHAYFIEKADNYYIRDFFERHGRYYAVLFDWESLDRGAAIEAVQQHRDILEAILADDRHAAAQALDFHIRNNHSVLKRLPAGEP